MPQRRKVTCRRQRARAPHEHEGKRIGLRVIDASQQGWGVINDDLFLSNVEVRQVIRRWVEGSLG